MSDLIQELRKIKEAVAAQENLRGMLPDTQIEASLRPLKEKKAELEVQIAGTDGGGYQVVGGGTIVTDGGTAVGERGVHIGGSVTGSIITGDNSRILETIKTMPQVSVADKQELERLLDQLREAVANAAPGQQEEAQELVKVTEELVFEAAKPQPNKTRLQITGEGLKKAAENIAEIMPIVGRIVTAIFRIGGVSLG